MGCLCCTQSRKLEQIRYELAKLDDVLAGNIDLLRREIEVEDRALSDARRNFDRLQRVRV